MLDDLLKGKMGDILMETIAPGLGVFIALAMFASPIFAVLKVMKTGVLGVRTSPSHSHCNHHRSTPGPQPTALLARDGQLRWYACSHTPLTRPPPLRHTGWVGYSLTNGDLYVFFANGPGFLVGSFLVFGTFPHAPKMVGTHKIPACQATNPSHAPTLHPHNLSNNA